MSIMHTPHIFQLLYIMDCIEKDKCVYAEHTYTHKKKLNKKIQVTFLLQWQPAPQLDVLLAHGMENRIHNQTLSRSRT